jgi:transcription elongation factor
MDIFNQVTYLEQNGRKSRILSAFSSLTRAGFVFIETEHHAIQDVLPIISSVSSCLATSTNICIVPVQDRAHLLEIPKRYSPAHGDWLRFQHGLYKNDVALVIEMNETTQICEVCVVPRLRLDNSGRTRPARALFDPIKVRKLKGESSVQSRNQCWFFEKMYYKDGLQEISVPFDQFIPARATPSYEELCDFSQTSYLNFEQYMKWLSVLARKSLKRGDKVHIISGETAGIHGRIIDIIDTETVRIEYLTNQIKENVDVLIDCVKALYSVGDTIRVVRGDDADATGWIVEVDDKGFVHFFDNAKQRLVRTTYYPSHIFI